MTPFASHNLSLRSLQTYLLSPQFITGLEPDKRLLGHHELI